MGCSGLCTAMLQPQLMGMIRRQGVMSLHTESAACVCDPRVLVFNAFCDLRVSCDVFACLGSNRVLSLAIEARGGDSEAEIEVDRNPKPR